MNLKKLVIAAVIAAATCGASAATYNFGPIAANTEYDGDIKVNKGSFTDYLTFQVTSPLYSAGFLANVKLGTLRDIDNMSVGFYTGTVGSGSLMQQLPNDSGTFAGAGNLLAGSYYFKVEGNAIGSKGGQYSYSVATAPVPEPETYAMFLAGLGIIGAIAKRRSRA